MKQYRIRGSDYGDLDLLVVGIITSPFALNGFLSVRSYSGTSEHLRRLNRVIVDLDNRRFPMDIAEIKPAGAHMRIKFVKVDNVTEARRYCGAELLIPRQDASPCQPDEYYVADLCGAQVVHGGQIIGKVHAVIENGQNDILEIKNMDDASIFIPFRRQFIGEVDVAQRTIELIADWILP